MSRYIEYHDICSAICNQQDGTGMTYEALAHAMVEIQLAPSIDIVRCKECKYWRAYETWSVCELWTGDPYEAATTKPDDFCSYGERNADSNTFNALDALDDNSSEKPNNSKVSEIPTGSERSSE